MNYLAIYRKYRPTNFDEVSGQKIVVDILKNSIKNNKIAHAYLFTGPRGTGKTSVAKIFARTINCESNNTIPCEHCSSCLNSASKECVDIIEIDAASNNGVDEIRELKSKINIVPSFLKYKIYIIDEVHMLSIGAFNALLKTLEEPPTHVIFILATTELQKVPATILSRCQILEFKKIAPADMKRRIVEICNKENIEIEEAAIEEIINFSDGCMRDALSLLEKLNSYCEEKITEKEVRNICGKVSKEEINYLIENIFNDNIKEVITKVNELYLSDYEMLYIVSDIIDELENKLFKPEFQKKDIFDIMSRFIDTYDKMKNSSVNRKIILELGLLNLLNNSDKNISREIFLEQKFDKNTKKEIPDVSNKKKVDISNQNKMNIENFKKVRINNTFVDASKEQLMNMKNKWEELKKYAFDKDNGSIICNLLDGVPVAANNQYLTLAFPYISMADKVNEDYQQFEKVLKTYIQVDHKIVGISEEEWKKYKLEYIHNLNDGVKYQIFEDIYADKESEKNDIISDIKLENSNSSGDIENKAYELFDSDFVEVE